MNLAEEIFKHLIWDNVVKAVLARLFALIPLLGWGPIGYVVTFFVTKYSDLLYEAVKMFFAIEKIYLTNESLQRNFDNSSVKLKIFARDYGIESKEFLEERENEKRLFSTFIKFDVARVHNNS